MRVEVEARSQFAAAEVIGLLFEHRAAGGVRRGQAVDLEATCKRIWHPSERLNTARGVNACDPLRIASPLNRGIRPARRPTTPFERYAGEYSRIGAGLMGVNVGLES